MIFDRAMSNSKRRFLFTCPYRTNIARSDAHILINANDAGEALRKAKRIILERQGPATAKKKVRFTWGKPKKVATNKKYRGG